MLELLHQRFHGFFVSQTLEAMILGSLTASGMFILRLPFARDYWRFSSFYSIDSSYRCFNWSSYWIYFNYDSVHVTGYYFYHFLIILQQIEGNFIYPKVVGGSIGLPAMWVLMAITIGASLKGIVGMIIAVPLAATLYQVIKDNIQKTVIQKNKFPKRNLFFVE